MEFKIRRSLDDVASEDAKDLARKIIEHSKAWRDHQQMHPGAKLQLVPEEAPKRVDDHKPVVHSEDLAMPEKPMWRCTCSAVRLGVDEDQNVKTEYLSTPKGGPEKSNYGASGRKSSYGRSAQSTGYGSSQSSYK